MDSTYIVSYDNKGEKHILIVGKKKGVQVEILNFFQGKDADLINDILSKTTTDVESLLKENNFNEK